MNINYYEKMKKKLFCSIQEKIFHSSQMHTNSRACGPTHGTGQTRKVNPKLNYGTGQPDLHFAGQNAGWAKTGQPGPLCHVIPSSRQTPVNIYNFCRKDK